MSRRRWVYTEGGKPLPEPVEVGTDWRNVAPSTGDLGKFEYNNLRATDGTDISSRSKRNAYMRREGVADARDFTGVWAEARKKREAQQRGELSPAELRERTYEVGRTAWELLERKRSRR